MLIPAYFISSNSKYTMIYINIHNATLLSTTAEANIYSPSYPRSWGDQPKKKKKKKWRSWIGCHVKGSHYRVKQVFQLLKMNNSYVLQENLQINWNYVPHKKYKQARVHCIKKNNSSNIAKLQQNLKGRRLSWLCYFICTFILITEQYFGLVTMSMMHFFSLKMCFCPVKPNFPS